MVGTEANFIPSGSGVTLRVEMVRGGCRGCGNAYRV